MSSKANTTVIGAFVLGAIGLVVAGVLVFGSGRFLDDTVESHVLYFQGSVKGLSVGSPVNFRGVQIGEVSEINMMINRDSLEIVIPVVVEVYPNRFQVCCDEQGLPMGKFEDPYKAVDALIDVGLRAKLDILSLVTGQLVVDFDLYPDTPVELTGIDSEYHEIPTIPSSMEKFFEKLGKLPIEEIAQKALDVLEAVDTFMRNPELTDSVSELKQTLLEAKQLARDLQHLTKNVDRQVGPLSSEAQITMHVAQETMRDAQDALHEAEGLMTNLKQMTGKRSELRVEVLRALREVSDAMRAVRVLAEYLETHPETLIKGKPEPGGEQ